MRRLRPARVRPLALPAPVALLALGESAAEADGSGSWAGALALCFASESSAGSQCRALVWLAARLFPYLCENLCARFSCGGWRCRRTRRAWCHHRPPSPERPGRRAHGPESRSARRRAARFPPRERPSGSAGRAGQGADGFVSQNWQVSSNCGKNDFYFLRRCVA